MGSSYWSVKSSAHEEEPPSSRETVTATPNQYTIMSSKEKINRILNVLVMKTKIQNLPNELQQIVQLYLYQPIFDVCFPTVGLSSSRDPDLIYLIKVLVIGDRGVGKKALGERYVYKAFGGRPACSCGLDFVLKRLKHKDKIVAMQIWYGHEYIDPELSNHYYKNTHAILLCFDKWIQSKRRNNQYLTTLVGCKGDLQHQRQCDQDEIMSFTKKYGMEYVETSSKNSLKVRYMFNNVCRNMIAYGENRTMHPFYG